MSHITWGDRPLAQVRDTELVTDMNAMGDGYRLRDKTARLWVSVLRVFDHQGVPMTVRGLFYALEMLGLVPKSEAGYRHVAYQVLQMRRRGALPFSFIADGTRWVRRPDTYSGLGAYLERSHEAYRRALWDNQEAYVEVWCEKDAISGLLRQVTEPWDVPLYVTRGYPSETYLYKAAETIKACGKAAHIYYLGDLDPSGWNISQGIEKRLREFGADFAFERLAVRPEQIDEWRLPTRPAKRGDTRSKGWGWPCVEVDAIPAKRLRELCEQAITQHIDRKQYENTLRAEQLERDALAEISRLWAA